MPLQGCPVTRLHAERSFECIHSLQASLQTNPQMRTRGSESGQSAITAGRSTACADRGGEEDDTWRMPGSGRIWTARQGPGGPPPASPRWDVTSQVCEVPRESARGRLGAEAGREQRVPLGPRQVGPAPRDCGSGPGDGWVAGESGLGGVGRSLEPDSGG